MIGLSEARSRFSELLEEVAAGGSFTITRYGDPVARLMPVEGHSSRKDRERAIAAWREISGDISLGDRHLSDFIRKGPS